MININDIQVWIIKNPIDTIIFVLFFVVILFVIVLWVKLKKLTGLIPDISNELTSKIVELNTTLQVKSETQLNAIHQNNKQLRTETEHTKNSIFNSLGSLKDSIYQQQTKTNTNNTQSFLQLQQALAQQLKQQSEIVQNNVDNLNKTTESRLKEISMQVNNQLQTGFTKTQTTFMDIQKRLSVIDEAQKRIDFLSDNVVSLQNVLTDKKTRGAFGELQLQTIIENALPSQFVDFQFTLTNNKRADCIIHLPDPNGDICIDSKFPMESYLQLVESNENTKKAINNVFKQNIKKHINDISTKYINPPQTTDSAIMFIPAEAIFAEIHAYHPDLVELAQRKCVWLASPTTLMAVLTTAKSVIKDDATRKQAHIVREQLYALKVDFDRFQKRMDNLARHIEQANTDVQEVNTSATKISKHFLKIEATEEWDMGKKTEETNSIEK